MESAKLPDLSRLKAVKEQLKKLPRQKSIGDTSNWEQRGISSPPIDVKTNKTVVREFDFLLSESDDFRSLTAEQIQKSIKKA